DAREFEAAVAGVLADVGEDIASLYSTDHDGAPAQIEYVVWSDVRACPTCRAALILWDQREAGLRKLTCEACDYTGPKVDFPVIGERAVEVNLSQGRRRAVRDVRVSDLRPGLPHDDLPWFPHVDFDASRPMWRRGHEDLGITTVAGF